MAGDPYKYFRIEAREIVEEIGKGVLDLERGPASAELVARLLRLAHTLKGAARVVKERQIAEDSHAIEDLLAPHREGGSIVAPNCIEDVLKLLDAMSLRVSSLVAAPPAQAPRADHAPAPVVSVEEPARALRNVVSEVYALLEGVAEVAVPLARARRSLESFEPVRRMTDLLLAQIASPQTATEASSFSARSTIDELRRSLTTLERSLTMGMEQADRELRQVREAAERLRLMPAGAMFAFLERAARDAAVALGKRVVFEVAGGDVRLDGDVLGPVQSALLQAVRNAVAHGIEMESERVAAGKSAEGRIRVTVERRGNRVAFACADDGRGIDAEAVRREAAKRGVALTPEDERDPRAVTRLLLKGGISTSAAVTAVSGRGVGLDVVREAAARLSGEVDIRTEPNQGMTLEIIVPVTLSTVDVLVVDAGGVVAGVPLDRVRRTVRITESDVLRDGKGPAILVDGAMLPFAHLTRILGAGDSDDLSTRGASALILHSSEGAAAIGVDRLLRTESVVQRALTELVQADPVIAGVFLDAAGAPQAVLDSDALAREARRASTPIVREKAAKKPILVIDDSMTTRMLEQAILESAGYEVDVATSAEEGLDRAKARSYALFLVDVEMPGMDGFTFVETTRADPVLRATPAILVTSRAAPEDKKRG
ncbi:MAG: hybrid sensor histidine kinase/response regulator [Polyangiaceae bacterium]